MNSKEAERQMGVAIRLIATGLSIYAKAYNAWAKELLQDNSEGKPYKLGNDGVAGQAWKDIAHGVLRGLLNAPFRGFEPITVSHEVWEAAKEAGIDLDK